MMKTGKYNDATGQTVETSCKSCSIGKYNDLTGQISCKTCESGKEPRGDQFACKLIGEQESFLSCFALALLIIFLQNEQ